MTKSEEVFNFIFQAMPFTVIQDFENIYRQIEKAGGSVSEFCDLVAAYKESHKLIVQENVKIYREYRANFKMRARRCDKCGNIMMLSEVNTVPGNQVGGNLKSLWSCHDVMGCGNEEYSEATFQDEAAKNDMSEFYDPVVRRQIESNRFKRMRRRRLHSKT